MSLRDEGDAPGSNAEDSQLSGNLLPPVLGLVGIGVLACAVWAFGLNGNYPAEELLRCSAISDGPLRLVCYDQVAMVHEPAKGALAPIRIYPPEESR